MNRKLTLRFLIYLTAIIIVCTGCSSSATNPTSTSIPKSTSTSTFTPTLTAIVIPTVTPEPTEKPLEHKIGVRVVDRIGEFFNRSTGTKFIPRGNNYIRLAEQQSTSGAMMFYHSTFNVGLYDPVGANQALQEMHSDGYNLVRVFINGGCMSDCIGDPDGGLSEAYIANVVDFLRKAEANEIFVILTTDSEPGTDYYFDLLDTTWSSDFGGVNSSYLRGGGVLVGRMFWQELIDELVAQEAPLNIIFAYELRNELFFETNAGPFTLTSGTVETSNGKTYDMASDTDRQRMMDENLVHWIDQIRAAILERDPTALVTVGFFPPDSPNPWASAPRYIRTYPAVWQSTLDFIDFHPYPGGYSLDKLVENFGMTGLEDKPVIIGEFGGARSSYASESGLAQVLQDWQVESCLYGFDGWLLWTWDSAEQIEFYNGLSGDGEINQVLAPVNRSDPCLDKTFDFFETNLALGASVSASKSLQSNPASLVVDGTAEDWWGAGDFAPQWIEIDLGEPMAIGAVRLVVSQSPAGITRHQLWGGPSRADLQLLYTFEEETSDLQTLEYYVDEAIQNIRYLRVKTVLSPSWIGWREIEVLAP
ncbi:MAG: cellulase family glycosylhydrolase [Anaerolineaceae bacterium]|nr:cellulase family glycosylhydrolase [Anaerolineaceae bacterium]